MRSLTLALLALWTAPVWADWENLPPPVATPTPAAAITPWQNLPPPAPQPTPPPDPAPAPALDQAAQALVDAGRAYPGVRCLAGRHDPLLQRLAESHASAMAAARKQSHAGFQARYDEVRRQLGLSATEICAESWRDQAAYPLDRIARSQYDAWRSSRGHWSVASADHAAWGAGMAKGSNGTWYAVILVADPPRGGELLGTAEPLPEWPAGLRGGPAGHWVRQCGRRGCTNVWVLEVVP